MKDILARLAHLEKTTVTKPRKQRLTEDGSTPPTKAETKPSRLRDIFEAMSIGQKPLPVLDKEGGQQQAAPGFLNITDRSPAGMSIQKAVGDLAASGKAQIVMPQQGGTAQQGSQANGRMSGAGAPNPNALKPSIGSTVQEAGKPVNNSNIEKASRLEEIKEEIKHLVREAFEVVRGTSEEGRAKAYWYPHICMALDDDHGYMGRSMSSMQDAVDALYGESDEDDDNEDDDAELNEMGRLSRKLRGVEGGQEEHEFNNGDKVALADSPQGEVFTLSQWDGTRGWIGDKQGRGWYIRASQIVPAEDDEDEYDDDDILEADIPSDQMDMGAGLGAGRSQTTLEGKDTNPEVQAINDKIIAIFKRHGIKTPKGEEDFWNKVNDVGKNSRTDKQLLIKLSNEWEAAVERSEQ